MRDFKADDRETEGLLNRTYNFNRIGNGTHQLYEVREKEHGDESQNGRKEGCRRKERSVTRSV